MRFVDGEQADLRAFEQGAETFAARPLGGDVELVEFASRETVLCLAPVGIGGG